LKNNLNPAKRQVYPLSLSLLPTRSGHSPLVLSHEAAPGGQQGGGQEAGPVGHGGGPGGGQEVAQVAARRGLGSPARRGRGSAG